MKKDTLIQFITEPNLRSQIQDMLEKEYNITYPDNMHIQADVERIILNEIEKYYKKQLRIDKFERINKK